MMTMKLKKPLLLLVWVAVFLLCEVVAEEERGYAQQEEAGDEEGGFDPDAANALFNIYKSWPPPSSYYTESDCFLKVGACTSLRHGETIDQQEPSVAVTLYCPSQPTTPAQSYIVPVSEYMSLAVQHHTKMQTEFCASCHNFCHNSTWNSWQSYEFARGRRRSLRGEETMRTEPDFYYDCSACVEACQWRNETRVQNTAMSFGTCGVVQGDHEYFGGPMCMDGTMELVFFPRPWNATTNTTMCHAESVRDVLTSDHLDPQVYSHVMWKTITSLEQPLSCGRRGGQPPGDQDDSSWCSDIRKAGILCHATSINQLNATTTTQEDMVDFLCRINQQNLPANMAPPIPTVPHTASRFGSDDPSFYDLTGQSMQFLQCQQGSGTDDITTTSAVTKGLQQDEDESAIRTLEKPRATFQLCWKSDMETMNYCSPQKNYCHNYTVDLSTYLSIVTSHQEAMIHRACSDCSNSCGLDVHEENDDAVQLEEELQGALLRQQQNEEQQVPVQARREPIEMVCDACLQDPIHKNSCWDRDDQIMDWYSETTSSLDCDTCGSVCSKLQSMIQNGYLDATTFNKCTLIFDDGESKPLYAGPFCRSASSSRIAVNIGVFLDDQCQQLDPTKDVDDYMVSGDGYPMKLAYVTLQRIVDADRSFPCSSDPATYFPRTGLNRSPQASTQNQLCRELFQASVLVHDEKMVMPPQKDVFDSDFAEGNSSSPESSSKTKANCKLSCVATAVSAVVWGLFAGLLF